LGQRLGQEDWCKEVPAQLAENPVNLSPHSTRTAQ
jgi:hypothetical protein